MSRINWGGALIGAFAGLGATAVGAVILFASGLRVGSSTLSDAAFVLVQLGGQLGAGFVGGRFGRPSEAFHGALSALTLFAVTALISLGGGARPGPVLLFTGGLVALGVGSAGGVLGARR